MLKNLLRAKPSQVEAEYLPGFWVTVRYVSLSEINRALEKSSRPAIRGGRIRDQAGAEAVEAVLRRAVVDWRGLTAQVLLSLNIDVDPDHVLALGDQEIPCDDDNKRVLIESDIDFRNWVLELATNAARMRDEQLEAERKNSSRP